MQSDEADAIKAVISEGVADTMFKLSRLDKNPLRDCRVIANAIVSALSAAGYQIVPRDA